MKALPLATTLLFTAPVSAGLINGGFESYPAQSYSFFQGTDPYSGWATTANDNTLEIWSSWTEGVPAYEGNCFAELNAYEPSTLYQIVSGLPAATNVNWHFAHRGRWGTDTMRLTITDLGANGTWDGGVGDDTTLFTDLFSADDTAWQVHYGSVAALGNDTRFAFEAVSAAGGPTIGNLIDFCGFGTSVVPAPGAMVLLGFGVLFGVRRRA
jgi:hypothetical protein